MSTRWLLLALFFFGSAAASVRRADIADTEVQLNNIHEALRMYQADCGTYPLSGSFPEILYFSAGAACWAGPYLTGPKTWKKGQPLVDAWKQPIYYHMEGERVVLWSAGCDGVSGTADDIVQGSAVPSRPSRCGDSVWQFLYFNRVPLSGWVGAMFVVLLLARARHGRRSPLGAKPSPPEGF